MSLSSGDRSFSIIVAQRKLATPAILAAKEEAFFALAEEGVSFDRFLVSEGVLEAAKAEEIVRLRARHGRTCAACGRETFLLPGETVASRPCEHCGGKLRAPAPPPARSGPPPRGGPTRVVPGASGASATPGAPSAPRVPSRAAARATELRPTPTLGPEKTTESRPTPTLTAPKATEPRPTAKLAAAKATEPRPTPTLAGEDAPATTSAKSTARSYPAPTLAAEDARATARIGPVLESEAPAAVVTARPTERRARTGAAGSTSEPATAESSTSTAETATVPPVAPATPAASPTQRPARVATDAPRSEDDRAAPEPGAETADVAKTDGVAEVAAEAPPESPAATDAPATGVAATGVAATDAPATDVPATAADAPATAAKAAQLEGGSATAPGAHPQVGSVSAHGAATTPPKPSLVKPRVETPPEPKLTLAERFLRPGRAMPTLPPPPERLSPRDEVREVLGYAFRDGGLVFISIGAVCIWLCQLIAGFSLMGLLLSIAAFLYFHTFLFHVIERAGGGKTDMPDWPDAGSYRDTGWKLLACYAASFLPVIALGIGGCALSVGAVPEVSSAGPTVGPNAAHYGGACPALIGADVSSVELVDEKDVPHPLGARGGHWLVLAALEDSTEPGHAAHVNNPDAMGLLRARARDPGYAPANQLADLERLAASRKDTDVVSCALTPSGGRLASLVARFGSAHDPEAPHVTVWRGNETCLPAPLEQAVVDAPCLFLIDPTGTVRKVYRGGASDTYLSLVIDDLKRGGKGEPNTGAGLVGVLAAISRILLFLVGVLLLGAVCYAYFPMALLMTVEFGNGTLAFRYPAVVGSILRTRADYARFLAFSFGFLFLLSLGGSVAVVVLDAISPSLVSWLSGIVGTWFYFFWQVCSCYALGRFYHRNARELGWFVVGESEAPVHDAASWKAS